MAAQAAIDADARDADAGLGPWALPAALALCLAALALVLLRLAPPAPAPADAPAAEFSAGRARALLAHLAGDGAPRPTAGAASARAGERIAAALRRMGYRPRVEESFTCNRLGNCAPIRNIVAELPGRRPAAVLLMAHYDSMPASPGVSDDLTGVAAVLEVARAIKAGPPPRNSVLFLLDEGEENFLLGARAFVETSPAATRVRAVVNLEARGTCGPSLMFETSRENGWLMSILDRSLQHPVASSLFQLIYDYLPNATDFTVFQRDEIPGFNFALIGSPALYHSSLDNLANSSPASLQHHGDNALAAVRALAEADLQGGPRPGRAVFFDLLGYELFWWPAARGPALGIAALALVLATAVLLWRRGLLGGRALALGLLAWLATLALTLAAGYGLVAGLAAAGVLRATWPAHSLPPQAGIWLLALAVAGAVAWRRAGLCGLWAGVWIGWASLGLALSWRAPGASYLFVVPALVAGLSGPALLGAPAWRTGAALLPLLAAALLWFPLLLLVYQGLGLPLLWLIGLLAATVATPLLPLLGAASSRWRWGVSFTAALAAAALWIAVLALPPFAADSPQRLNLAFYQDADTGRGRWLVDTPSTLPPQLRRAAAFRSEATFPWSAAERLRVAAAPSLGLPAPQLSREREESAAGRRHLRLRIVSRRGAPYVILLIPAAAEPRRISLAGREVPGMEDRHMTMIDSWRRFQIAGVPPEGIEVDVVLGSSTPHDWYVVDRSPGLPAAGAALAGSRPVASAAFREGDTTVVAGKARI